MQFEVLVKRCQSVEQLLVQKGILTQKEIDDFYKVE